jgi:ABC-type Mn2+/Zn2+ transport system permease subunit
MKKPWFKEWGWIYRPVSWPGAVLAAIIFLFCVQVFVAVDRRSHSVSDTLYGIFPFWVPALGILLWIAFKTSSRNSRDKT